jgi:hypothetical protein
MSKGARFWSFLGSRVRSVLGGISSIPLEEVSQRRQANLCVIKQKGLMQNAKCKGVSERCRNV